MKALICILSLLLAAALPSFAGNPKPVENEFVKMEVAGFAFKNDSPSGASLQYRFMFVLKKPLKVTSVRIEDVTQKPPILLVDDKNPETGDGHWRGTSADRSVSRESFPWMYEDRDTKRVFRLTISSKEQPEMVLKQASRFDQQSKAQFLHVMEPRPKTKH